MTDRAAAIFEWLVSLPGWLLYLMVGMAAAIENLVPPLPADTFVVLGGVLAGAGHADSRLLFLVVWVGNVSSALLVYWIGFHYGSGFFQGRLGRFLLAPAQVTALERAYRRYGLPIIFFSRFLPVFRPIVPAFAGVAKVGFLATALPIALASALWYGLLVYLGTIAGENFEELLAMLGRVSSGMWAIAAVFMGLVVWWWIRHRRSPGNAV
jgi:membrane protein DedA with SNARE-associated domain